MYRVIVMPEWFARAQVSEIAATTMRRYTDGTVFVEPGTISIDVPGRQIASQCKTELQRRLLDEVTIDIVSLPLPRMGDA